MTCCYDKITLFLFCSTIIFTSKIHHSLIFCKLEICLQIARLQRRGFSNFFIYSCWFTTNVSQSLYSYSLQSSCMSAFFHPENILCEPLPYFFTLIPVPKLFLIMSYRINLRRWHLLTIFSNLSPFIWHFTMLFQSATLSLQLWHLLQVWQKNRNC